MIKSHTPPWYADLSARALEEVGRGSSARAARVRWLRSAQFFLHPGWDVSSSAALSSFRFASLAAMRCSALRRSSLRGHRRFDVGARLQFPLRIEEQPIGFAC